MDGKQRVGTWSRGTPCRVGLVRNDTSVTSFVHLSFARRDRCRFGRMARNFPSVLILRFEAHVPCALTRTSSSTRVFRTEPRPSGFGPTHPSASPLDVLSNASHPSFVFSLSAGSASLEIEALVQPCCKSHHLRSPRVLGHVAVLRRVGFVRV